MLAAEQDSFNGSSMSPAATTTSAAIESSLFVSAPTDIGSLLLSMTFVLTSAMCFLSSVAIKRLGHYLVILCGYVAVVVFVACHLLPLSYVLVPGYLALGIVYGPLCISKLNLVILMANKLACGQHECCNALSSTPTLNPSVGVDGNEEHILFATKPTCSRDENIRRLARWYHAAQNFGIICGAVIAALMLTCSAFHPPNTLSHAMCLGTNRSSSSDPVSFSYSPVVSGEYLLTSASAQSGPPPRNASEAPLRPVAEALITMVSENNYDTNNHGERICGAASCPVWWSPPLPPSATFVSTINVTGSSGASWQLPAAPRGSSMRLQGTILMYLILGVLAAALTVCIGQFANKKNLGHSQHHHYNSVPGLVDTLFFAGPMAYFIGTEQGYILSDFLKVSSESQWLGETTNAFLTAHLAAPPGKTCWFLSVSTNGRGIV